MENKKTLRQLCQEIFDDGGDFKTATVNNDQVDRKKLILADAKGLINIEGNTFQFTNSGIIQYLDD